MENYDEEQATAVRTEDVDRAEEERLITCIRTAKYLEGLRRYYNRNIKGRSFAVGDLVLRKQKTKGMHKLSSPWEGPYVVKEVTRPGSVDTEFCPMPRTHAASQKGLLYGVDPPSFSTGVVDPTQSSRGMPVNLTL